MEAKFQGGDIGEESYQQEADAGCDEKTLEVLWAAWRFKVTEPPAG